jgi:hypothetical protein
MLHSRIGHFDSLIEKRNEANTWYRSAIEPIVCYEGMDTRRMWFAVLSMKCVASRSKHLSS